MIKSKIIFSILFIISLIPLKNLQKAGQYLGPILLRKNKRTVDAINKNLTLCFPEYNEQQRDVILRNRLGYMMQTLLEMSHLWTKNVEAVRKHLTSEKNEAFKQAINSDDGVLVLLLHQGNWEAMNAYLSSFKKVTAMYRPLKSKSLDRVIKQSREQMGTSLHPNNNNGIRAMYKALTNKGLVCILPDQVPDNRLGGVFAPLFNHEAYTMTLAQRLAKKTKAKVFVAAAYQKEGGFLAVVEPINEKFYNDDELISATTLNKHIEAFIVKDVAQSQLEYKRFRSEAQGRKSLYK